MMFVEENVHDNLVSSPSDDRTNTENNSALKDAKNI